MENNRLLDLFGGKPIKQIVSSALDSINQAIDTLICTVFGKVDSTNNSPYAD